jgi:hypothetical protein
MRTTSITPFLRVAIAIGFASVLAIASSPAWSQSLIGDGWSGSPQPNSNYRPARHSHQAPAAAQNQGNADWR